MLMDVGIAPVTTALDTLVAGLGAARQRQAEDASRVAADPGDLEAIVGLETERLGIAAMARALRTVDDTERSLVDVLA
jgi:hypothetical protein